MSLRSTHTFALLEVSPAAYDEIKTKLIAAGYAHACRDDAIDMNEIGLSREPDGAAVGRGSHQESGSRPYAECDNCQEPIETEDDDRANRDAKRDAERYRALKKWHDAPGLPEFDLDEGADALIDAARLSSSGRAPEISYVCPICPDDGVKRGEIRPRYCAKHDRSASGGPPAEPRCPDCKGPLSPVVRPEGNTLSVEEHSRQYGDWRCDSCPPSNATWHHYRVFWNWQLIPAGPTEYFGICNDLDEGGRDWWYGDTVGFGPHDSLAVKFLTRESAMRVIRDRNLDAYVGTLWPISPLSSSGRTPADVPWRTSMMPTSWYEQLDSGIRFAVRVLHAAGSVETCQSCQGGAGHAYDWPTIDLIAGGDDAAGFAALGALRSYGLPVRDVSIVWPVRHGTPYEKLWRITFWKSMEDRVNEMPNFIHGVQAQ